MLDSSSDDDDDGDFGGWWQPTSGTMWLAVAEGQLVGVSWGVAAGEFTSA